MKLDFNPVLNWNSTVTWLKDDYHRWLARYLWKSQLFEDLNTNVLFMFNFDFSVKYRFE